MKPKNFVLVAILIQSGLSLATNNAVSASRFDGGSYVVTLRDDASLENVMIDHHIAKNDALLFTAGTPGFSSHLSGSQAMSLVADNRVKAVEAEHIARTDATQTTFPVTLTSPNVRIPWGLDRIDQTSKTLDGTYTPSTNGTGVKVYVVDSGVNASHPEINSRITPSVGWSYRAVSDSQSALWFSNTGSCKTNTSTYTYSPNNYAQDVDTFDRTYTSGDYGQTDNEGHGTHVAGIVAGTNTGVAKNATIIPVRVLNSCGVGVTSMIKAGIEWILANHQIGEPAVVNLSVGFTTSDTAVDTAIANLLAEGITVVAAAGNSGQTSCNTTPAGTAGTISVGAVDSTDTEAFFSNYGECVDILAPGYQIPSSWPYYKIGSTVYTDTYLGVSGTSMSAPHVSGVAALRLQSVPTSTPTQMWEWIKSRSVTDGMTYVSESVLAARGFPSRLGTIKSPNRMLSIAGTQVVPAVVAPTALKVVAAPHALEVSWAHAVGDGAGITYTVVATPGGATCSVVGKTCTLTKLVNGTSYSLAVTATDTTGTTATVTTTGTPVGPPEAPISVKAVVASRSLVVSWAHAVGDGAGITYKVVATPGDATCSVIGTTCTLADLVNGRSYSLSIAGTDTLGTGDATTITAVPDGPPEVPLVAQSVVANRSVTFTWPLITTSDAITYIVTASPGGQTCETIEATCTVTNLTNGADYTFAITTRSGTGQETTSSAVQLISRPGFVLNQVTVPRAKRLRLTSIVSSISPGKKTWSETGLCNISGSYLNAPKKTAKCAVTLRIAKSGSFPAMSTKVFVQIT